MTARSSTRSTRCSPTGDRLDERLSEDTGVIAARNQDVWSGFPTETHEVLFNLLPHCIGGAAKNLDWLNSDPEAPAVLDGAEEAE